MMVLAVAYRHIKHLDHIDIVRAQGDNVCIGSSVAVARQDPNLYKLGIGQAQA